ncbi:hypothetical protein Ancab_023849 [Ancistrocladus abbreviatus]
MGIQTMGTQAVGGSSSEKQTQSQPLAQQNSMYSLTLDEVRSQLGDLGKPLSSMNLDELLKSVLTVEANQPMGMDIETTALAHQSACQCQTSLSLTGSLGRKTVDEVWQDIQQGQNKNLEKTMREKQPTLGEMTLEDFLVKAGVVAEGSLDKRNKCPAVNADSTATQQFTQQEQWMQYQQAQLQHQQIMMGVYMPGQPMPQPMPLAGGSILDVSYSENQAPLPSSLMVTLSDTQASGRKRLGPDNTLDKSVERRQKRMIKNRESAARSRARKQAYTNELENKVSRLEEENESLRKRKELEKLLPSLPPPEPRYQLRRTSSALF